MAKYKVVSWMGFWNNNKKKGKEEKKKKKKDGNLDKVEALVNNNTSILVH